MRPSTPKSGCVRDLLRWFFCVVIAMGAQILLLLLWSFLGPGNSLNRIMDCFYGSVASRIGMLFSEEQMFLGNIGLGLSLVFLTVMLYSVVIGTVFYLVCWLCARDMPQKTVADH